jgi:hypothetical protein
LVLRPGDLPALPRARDRLDRRMIPTSANGQPATAAYHCDATESTARSDSASSPSTTRASRAHPRLRRWPDLDANFGLPPAMRR